MTRHPKAGKGNKWTELELKCISKDWKGDTLGDGEGLTGQVRVNGNDEVSIQFKYAFKLDSKKTVHWYYCGIYPNESISRIRKNRDSARESVKSGIDPRIKKKTEKIIAKNELDLILADEKKKIEIEKAESEKNLTFMDLFNSWIRDGVNRSDNNKFIIQSFNKHAFPVLGNIYIRNLNEHNLRDLYRKIISDGKIATAVELSKDIKQMFKWGEVRKPWRPLLIEGNPVDLVEIKKLVPKGYTKERKRFLSTDEIKQLNNIFLNITNSYAQASNKYNSERPLKKESQLALWICLGTLSRIGELLMARWEHVNFDKKTWFIPKENVKGEDGQKHDQLVYLSNFTFDKFYQLYELNKDSPWVFPARYVDGHVCIKSVSKQVGDRQIKFKNRSKKLQCRVENNSLVLGDEDWTPHDLRKTGATMMQQLKVSRDIINLCQNHAIGSKVDRVYLLYDFADEKREAWNKLGDKLDETLN